MSGEQKGDNNGISLAEIMQREVDNMRQASAILKKGIFQFEFNG